MGRSFRSLLALVLVLAILGAATAVQKKKKSTGQKFKNPPASENSKDRAKDNKRCPVNQETFFPTWSKGGCGICYKKQSKDCGKTHKSGFFRCTSAPADAYIQSVLIHDLTQWYFTQVSGGPFNDKGAADCILQERWLNFGIIDIQTTVVGPNRLGEDELAIAVYNYLDSEGREQTGVVLTRSLIGRNALGNDFYQNIALEDRTIRDTDVRVSSVLYKAYLDATRLKTWDAIEDKYKHVKDEKKMGGVCIGGIDKGSAVGGYLALRLLEQHIPVKHVYLYSAPKPGDQPYVDLLVSNLTPLRMLNVWNDRDINPLFPPNNDLINFATQPGVLETDGSACGDELGDPIWPEDTTFSDEYGIYPNTILYRIYDGTCFLKGSDDGAVACPQADPNAPDEAFACGLNFLDYYLRDASLIAGNGNPPTGVGYGIYNVITCTSENAQGYVNALRGCALISPSSAAKLVGQKNAACLLDTLKDLRIPNNNGTTAQPV